MRLEALEAFEGNSSPLHRLDARFKILGALAFVIAVVATPMGWWRLLGTLGLGLAFLIRLSGVPSRVLFLRWLGFFVPVSFLAAMAAPSLSARAGLGLGTVILTILIKNSLAFLMMLLLASVTPWQTMLVAMRKLRMPQGLLATLQFMERYLHVLGDQLGRMITARRARSFHARGILSWNQLTGMIGMLLLRSMERAERVHAAMTARGWDGTIRSLDD
jgi:cobalt/nickel transport system permease protein